ncbi:MAG: hypothetical protein IJI35_18840 [Kiritimatiellae bacterium]|nr:hypothetical protein [Kiritimatiellia bacterium]
MAFDGRIAISALLAAAMAAGAAGTEAHFAFTNDLETVHQAGRRNTALAPRQDELVVGDGFAVCAGKDATALVRRAAKDFVDYLAVSMGVKGALVEKAKAPGVAVVIDGSMKKGAHEIKVGASGVRIRAADERAAAQGFYRLEDRMNLRCAPFLKHGVELRAPLYSPRMSHPGYRVDVFPDGYLGRMAHAGIDAIVIYVNDADLKENSRDLGDIIRRAKAWGLDAYFYPNRISTPAHPSDPGAEKVYEDSYGKLTAKYPGVKGFVFVGESVFFPSKDERVKNRGAAPSPEDKRPPQDRFACRDWGDWLKAVQKAVRRNIPDADFLFWSYSFVWNKLEIRREMMERLPKDVKLHVTFELGGGNPRPGGYVNGLEDYTIASPGPSVRFKEEAAMAKELGLGLSSMVNTLGRTWDFGTAPYEPFPFQWKRRWEAMRPYREGNGLVTIMENHHYGWMPNFVSDLAKEAFTEGGMDFETHVRAIAARDFGPAAADEVLAAWREMSEAICDYSATSRDQYGPYRIGPAYPFTALQDRIPNADFPPRAGRGPKDRIGYICRINYLDTNFAAGIRDKSAKEPAFRKECELLKRMSAKMAAGADRLARAADSAPAFCAARARREAGVASYIACCVATLLHVKAAAAEQLAIESGSLDAAGEKAARERILALARAERANAAKALPLVQDDSRLGYEASMGYHGGEEQIRWKIGLIDRFLSDNAH